MKRGAFELSLTTIVVLVIAVVLLILGLIFVKRIMCGGMLIAEETLHGARTQIAKLFGETGGEIRCMGAAGTNPPTIVPGRANAIGCNYYPETKTEYTFTVKNAQFKSLGETQPKNVMGWFITTRHTTTAKAGESSIGGVVIKPPKGTSAGTLVIEIEVTSKREGETETYKDTLTFEVKTLGFLRETIC